MEPMDVNRRELIYLAARLVLFTALTYYTLKLVNDAVDSEARTRHRPTKKTKKLLEKLKLQGKEIELTHHEMLVAANLICPEELDTNWCDIVGLEDVVEQIQCTVLMPIERPDLREQSSLFEAPKGVLLYGPPGCGKTMMAKAVAAKANARFLNVDLSQLADKWYGESLKLVSAVFSLAQKIEPCIVFVDEIDALLRTRANTDNDTTTMVKAEFMQMWDGLATNRDATVVVMGATNRPDAIDGAILRRLPTTFYVGLPDGRQRKAMFDKFLAGENLDPGVNMETLVQNSDRFSGSDIREVCRSASVSRVKDLINREGVGGQRSAEPLSRLRSITNEDLSKAIGRMVETKLACGHFYT